MLSLFDNIPILPEGFSYFPEFLSGEEENILLAAIDVFELMPMRFHGYTAKRKTANFGYDWSFENRTLSKGKDIPPEFNFLMDKVAAHFGFAASEIAELLLTYYPPAAVINWHRDAPPYERIIGISLLSDCIFKFRPYDKAKQGRGSILSLPVTRRSMYIMAGEARSDWEHSIDPVRKERFSITLRTLR